MMISAQRFVFPETLYPFLRPAPSKAVRARLRRRLRRLYDRHAAGRSRCERLWLHVHRLCCRELLLNVRRRRRLPVYDPRNLYVAQRES